MGGPEPGALRRRRLKANRGSPPRSPAGHRRQRVGVTPKTLRKIGTVCFVFGIAGLAYTLLLLMTGATISAGTVALIPIQSAVNVAAGWSLRRRADQLEG